MANSFTASDRRVYGTIDTTGSSDAITVTGSRLVDFALNVDGSWAGTVTVDGEYLTGSSNAAEWLPIASYSADTTKVFSNATTRRMRVSGTVTTGSCTFELTAGNKES